MPSVAEMSDSDLAELVGCCDRWTLRLDRSFPANAAPLERVLRVAGTRGPALGLEIPMDEGAGTTPARLATLASRCLSVTGRLPVLSLQVAAGLSPVIPYRRL